MANLLFQILVWSAWIIGLFIVFLCLTFIIYFLFDFIRVKLRIKKNKEKLQKSFIDNKEIIKEVENARKQRTAEQYKRLDKFKESNNVTEQGKSAIKDVISSGTIIKHTREGKDVVGITDADTGIPKVNVADIKRIAPDRKRRFKLPEPPTL